MPTILTVSGAPSRATQRGVMKAHRTRLIKRIVLLVLGLLVAYLGWKLLQHPGIWFREDSPWQSKLGQMLMALAAIVMMMVGIWFAWFGLAGKLPAWLAHGLEARK